MAKRIRTTEKTVNNKGIHLEKVFDNNAVIGIKVVKKRRSKKDNNVVKALREEVNYALLEKENN